MLNHPGIFNAMSMNDDDFLDFVMRQTEYTSFRNDTGMSQVMGRIPTMSDEIRGLLDKGLKQMTGRDGKNVKTENNKLSNINKRIPNANIRRGNITRYNGSRKQGQQRTFEFEDPEWTEIPLPELTTINEGTES